MNDEHIGNDPVRRLCPDGEQVGRAEDDRKAPGMDVEQEQHPQSHLFTLRVWEEALGEGKMEWRGRVQEIASGETQFFRDWPGLIATLRRLIAKTANVYEGGPSQPFLTRETDG